MDFKGIRPSLSFCHFNISERKINLKYMGITLKYSVFFSSIQNN